MKRLLPTLLAVGALAAFSTLSQADSTIVTNSFTGHTYKAFYTPKTYSQAKTACENQGGYLAVISDNYDWYVIANDVISQNTTLTYRFGEYWPANQTQAKTVTNEPYYTDYTMGFREIHGISSTTDHLTYAAPAAISGFYWTLTGSIPYVCEWN